jgi:hypothetical protein
LRQCADRPDDSPKGDRSRVTTPSGPLLRAEYLERILHNTFSTPDEEEPTMIAEISFLVGGLDHARDGSNHALEKLAKTLEGLSGVLAARCDPESRRLTVRYDPSHVTILRILSRIESAGRQQGLVYRATDIRKGFERLATSGSQRIRRNGSSQERHRPSAPAESSRTFQPARS